MNTVIYDITADEHLKKILKAERGIRYRNKFYVDDFGEFGTKDWFHKLEDNGLISVIEGVVLKVYVTGHGDYPEFEIAIDNGGLKKFERKGNENKYKVGEKLKLHVVNSDNIFSEKINSAFLLRVEVI